MGVLFSSPDHAEKAHKKLFDDLKFQRNYAPACLAGLILLFQGDREKLLSDVRLRGVDIKDQDLDLYLDIAKTPSSSQPLQ